MTIILDKDIRMTNNHNKKKIHLVHRIFKKSKKRIQFRIYKANVLNLQMIKRLGTKK